MLRLRGENDLESPVFFTNLYAGLTSRHLSALHRSLIADCLARKPLSHTRINLNPHSTVDVKTAQWRALLLGEISTAEKSVDPHLPNPTPFRTRKNSHFLVVEMKGFSGAYSVLCPTLLFIL